MKRLSVATAVLAGLTGVSATPVLQAQEVFSWVATSGTGSYLGIGVAEIDETRMKALALREERGVEVTRVEAGSPAEKAGLKVGDVILDYNGQRIEGLQQFMRMVRETPSGREVKLGLSRSGKGETLAVRTTTRKENWVRPALNEQLGMLDRDLKDLQVTVPQLNMTWRSGRLGIEGESLDGQLASYFGVQTGVLVRNVTAGSAAEKAGVKAGDVITKINGKPVKSTREISEAIREGNRTATDVTLMRDKREMSVSATIEAPRGSGEPVRLRAVRPPAPLNRI